MMQRARSHMTSTCSYILRTAALGLLRRLLGGVADQTSCQLVLVGLALAQVAGVELDRAVVAQVSGAVVVRRAAPLGGGAAGAATVAALLRSRAGSMGFVVSLGAHCIERGTGLASLGFELLPHAVLNQAVQAGPVLAMRISGAHALEVRCQALQVPVDLVSLRHVPCIPRNEAERLRVLCHGVMCFHGALAAVQALACLRGSVAPHVSELQQECMLKSGQANGPALVLCLSIVGHNPLLGRALEVEGYMPDGVVFLFAQVLEQHAPPRANACDVSVQLARELFCMWKPVRPCGDSNSGLVAAKPNVILWGYHYD